MAAPTGELIERVEAHYNSARTLSVDFTEQYSILGRKRAPEAGTLRLQKQGKMRWEYRQPAGKLFVSDGKLMYLYTAADNRVQRVPLKQADDLRAPMAFLLGKLDLRKEFRGLQVEQATGVAHVRGFATSDRAPYETADMTVRPDGSIARLEVKGRDESVLAFEFANELRNVQLPPDLFRFAPPPGAEIVDGLAVQQGER